MYLDPRQQRAAQLRTIRQREKKARIAAVAAALRTNGPQADHLSASNSSIET
jgi:hypothetical protein